MKLGLELETDTLEHLEEIVSLENEDAYYQNNPQEKRGSHDCRIFKYLFTINKLTKAAMFRTDQSNDSKEIRKCTLYMINQSCSLDLRIYDVLIKAKAAVQEVQNFDKLTSGSIWFVAINNLRKNILEGDKREKQIANNSSNSLLLLLLLVEGYRKCTTGAEFHLNDWEARLSVEIKCENGNSKGLQKLEREVNRLKKKRASKMK